ncbi:MAG: phosphate ABC transporter permease subunit PstC [Phycisphaerae bacterium]|nr:phosphate ABC transporter permease subunit PstC [Phycisphaerae bacterium]
MDNSTVNLRVKSGAVQYRPLALTPGQDLTGYVLSKLGKAILFLMTCSSVFAVLLIFFFVIRESLIFFRDQGLWASVSTNAWYPKSEDPRYGMLALLAGSVYVTLAALAFSVPLGVMAAVFLSDLVSFKVRAVVKPVIEILAAIPSVAYGFFAVMVMAPWMQDHWHFSTGTNALNAAIILSIMALPTIISVAEDSVSSLGRELREASYALGATRFETLFKVVIPAAHSGIIAAIILGMMRAIGETMVVWMASGNASQIPSPWWDLSQSVRTMTATIAGEMGETEHGSIHYGALFAVGVYLLVITLGLNLISEFFLARAKKALGKA